MGGRGTKFLKEIGPLQRQAAVIGTDWLAMFTTTDESGRLTPSPPQKPAKEQLQQTKVAVTRGKLLRRLGEDRVCDSFITFQE